MDTWLNVGALWRVLAFGMIAGAGLPILFAVGVRAQAVGAGDRQAGPRASATGLAYLCFALVAAAVVIGVLFVARDFIGHHTGWYILGAKESS
jgi:hypothetical protein